MKKNSIVYFLVLTLVIFSEGCPKKTPPKADFSASPTSGTAPVSVQFTDRSAPGSADITSWQWDFGDGAKATSTEQNPAHTYTAAGAYTVSLTVSTADGVNTESKANFISITQGSEGEGEGEGMPAEGSPEEGEAEGQAEGITEGDAEGVNEGSMEGEGGGDIEGEGEGGPILSLTPNVQHLPATGTATTFAVTNAGRGILNWTATVTAGDWLTIGSGASGEGAGTINVNCQVNTGAVLRVGDVTVTAAGAGHSPLTVHVAQLGAASGTDSDNDMLTDDEEYLHGSAQEDADSDDDGLVDGDEVHVYGTSPTIIDTDGDGGSDREEIANGRNPLVPDNVPKAYQDFSAAVNDMTQKLRTDAATLPLNAALQEAADFLADQPNVSAVHFKQGTDQSTPQLWAEFTNYATFVVLITPKSAGPAVVKDAENGVPKPLPRPFAVKPVTKSGLLSQGFPENPCAFANLFDVNTNSANTQTLINMMIKKNYDARLISGNAGGVEFFKTLADYGVVYLDTHGGFIEDTHYVPTPTDPPGYKPRYAVIQTSDAQNAVQDQQYLANGDFAARRVTVSACLVTTAGDLGAIPAGRHYCVTNEFIKTYVGQFEDHSLVFMNCCQSAQTPAGVPYTQAPLFAAFMSKNAGTIFGWTESVGDAMAMKAGTYFFSRTLGDNDAIDTQHPPIAPYDCGDTFWALQNKHYDMDYDPTAQFVGYIRNYTEDLLLAPRIKFIVTDLENKELTLQGVFGDNGTPTVMAGNQELTIKTRDTDSIVVGLRDETKGPVTVKILDHVSNAVPLTQWSGTFHLHGDAGPMRPGLQGSITCRWRGDIHSERSQFPEDEACLPALEMCSFDLDSLYTYDFTSSYIADSMRYDYAGSGSVNQTLSPDGDTWLGGNVMMHMAGGYIQFAVDATAEVQVTVTNLQNGDVQHYTLPYPISLHGEWPIGSFGAITAGQTTANGTIQVTWDTFDVVGAPDDKTPAP